MNPVSNAHLLLVEDEPKVAAFIKKGLRTQSYLVNAALTGKEAKERFTATAFDLVILDVNLPDISGLLRRLTHRFALTRE